jgi:hypothetical protein
MPDPLPDPVDLSEHYAAPDSDESYGHYRFFCAQADAFGESAIEEERLTAAGWELAARGWLEIHQASRSRDLLDPDAPVPRDPAHIVASLREEWKAACAADDRLDAGLMDVLIAQFFDAVLARQHLGYLETLKDNQLSEGSREYDRYMASRSPAPSPKAPGSSRAPRPDELDYAPLCTNLAAMQKMWRVGEENARRSSLKAPDPATIQLAAGIGLPPTSAPIPPSSSTPPSAPRRRGT